MQITNILYLQKPAYTGEICETEKTFCELFPDFCVNGLCDNGGFCECYDGYEGPNCEFNIDNCIGHECAFGLCVDLLNDYECECSAGYQVWFFNFFDRN